MTTAYAIQSTIEVFAVIMLIFGYIYEDKLAHFERKMFHTLVNYIKSKTASKNQTNINIIEKAS